MVICDTHAHYDDEAFDADREALLGRELTQEGVEFLPDAGFTRMTRESLRERRLPRGCGLTARMM